MSYPILVVASLVGLGPVQSTTPARCPSGNAEACVAYDRHLAWGRVADADSVWSMLRYVATPAEAEAWYAATSEVARERFLRRFWEARAVASALYAEERFAEHLRRLEKARSWYTRGPRVQATGAGLKPYPFFVVAVASPPGEDPVRYARYDVDLNDRGLMLMRLGEPDRVERCTGQGRVETYYGEAWIYDRRRDEEAQVFLFGNAGAVYDPDAPANTFRSGPSGSDLVLLLRPDYMICDEAAMERVIQVAAEYDPQFHLAILDRSADDPLDSPLRAQRLSNHNRELATETAQREIAGPHYARELEAAFEFLDFASLHAGSDYTDVTLALAVPAAPLRADGEAGRFAARITLGVTDSSGRIASWSDTLRLFRSASPVPEGALLVLHLTVSLAPGSHNYALRIEGGAGAIGRAEMASEDTPTDHPQKAGAGFVRHGTLEVPRLQPAQRELVISALAVGRRGRGWSRRDIAFDLVPTHAFAPAEREATLYYELYGLQPDDSYATDILVERRSGLLGRRTGTELRFHDVASADATVAQVEHRVLDLAALEPGEYRVRIRVQTDAGLEVEGNTVIYLR